MFVTLLLNYRPPYDVIFWSFSFHQILFNEIVIVLITKLFCLVLNYNQEAKRQQLGQSLTPHRILMFSSLRLKNVWISKDVNLHFVSYYVISIHILMQITLFQIKIYCANFDFHFIFGRHHGLAWKCYLIFKLIHHLSFTKSHLINVWFLCFC